MGFKKFLNSTGLVEFDESEKKEVETKKPTSPYVIDNTDYNLPPSATINSSLLEKYRTKFSDILADENKRNFPGNDFFEFWQMKKSMDTIIPQENIKYTSAFATWNISSKSPQTKDQLLQTANLYLGIVEKEMKDFQEIYNQEVNTQVNTNNLAITQKTQRMAELSSELNKLDAEVRVLSQENVTNTAELKGKYESCMQAGNEQKEEILSEIQKINQFIN